MTLASLLSTIPYESNQYIKVYEYIDNGGGDAYDRVIFKGEYNSQNMNTERGDYIRDVGDYREVELLETKLTKDGKIAMIIYC